MNITEFKKEFDPILERLLDEKINNLTSLSSDFFINDFISYSKNLVFPGGKRIRPYLSYLTYSNFNGTDYKSAMEIFSSLEIFHTFALIHDDIMDKSTSRHGALTIHSLVKDSLEREKRLGDLTHTGSSQAILVGDLFFSWATDLFNSDSFSKDKMLKAKKYFYKMIDEVIMGQIIDVDLSTRESTTLDLINEKIKMKTTMYTFIRPMQIGASLADSDSEIEKFCEDLGMKLGFVFQMQDDLLDITGDSKKMKKDILRDISSRQHTFFTNHVFTNGTDKDKESLRKFFGKEITDKNQEEIVEIFINSGAISEGEKIIEKNILDAKEILHSFKKLKNKAEFEELIDKLSNREH